MTGFLPVPVELKALIESGFWPGDERMAMRQNLGSLVPEGLVRLLAPDETKVCFDSPPFRTVREEMERSQFWNDPRAAIDEIEPDFTLIIGDFGMGSDSPIVLDYSLRRDRPRVLRLRWSDGGGKNHWVEMAGSFGELAGIWKLG